MLRPSAASCTWPAYFSVASWYAFGQPTGRGSAIFIVAPRRRIHSIDGETRLPRRGMSPLVSTSPGCTSAARDGAARTTPTRAIHAIGALRGRMVPSSSPGGGRDARSHPAGRSAQRRLPAHPSSRRRGGRPLRHPRSHAGRAPHGPHRGRRQAPGGHPAHGPLRGVAPRWLGSRGAPRGPGARRRERRGALPDGRARALPPPGPGLQAGVHGRLQPLARRVLQRAPRPSPRRRPDRRAHARGRHRGPPADQGPRAARRDAPQPPRPGRLGQPDLRRALRGHDRARPPGLFPHPDRPAGRVPQAPPGHELRAMLVYGGELERHPRLRVVCVEADASWAPHWMHRMDHYYERHRYMRALELARLPSEYFREHVYLTFQDDWPAFRMTGLLDPRRLMWANDFPHSDSTWPWSQELLAREAACLSEGERDLILHDNAAELYGIEGV